MVMVVRYKDCPAGPYDELLYVPGLFSRKETADQYFLSNTRIYVSTDVSVANGRKEWGIPKHRADFSFDPVKGHPSKLRLTVSHPRRNDSTDSSTERARPFFAANLSDSKVTPFALPVRTSWLEWSISRWLMDGYEATLIQPALSSSVDVRAQVDAGTGSDEHAREAAKGQLAYLEETDQTVDAFTGSSGETLAFTPTATGWGKLCYLESLASIEPRSDTTSSSETDRLGAEGEGRVGGEVDEWSGFGDGVGFPKFKVAQEGLIPGRGVHLTSFEMHIPAKVVVPPS